MFNVSIYSAFGKLFGNDCCSILSQLIANRDYTISYMSASLLFDIYMKEQIVKSKNDIRSLFREEHVYQEGMWKCATMTDKELLLKKMLTKQLNDSKNCSDFLNRMANLCVNDSDKSMPYESFQKEAHCSGEYILEHND